MGNILLCKNIKTIGIYLRIYIWPWMGLCPTANIETRFAKQSDKQGCQIFRSATYQNGKNIPNDPKNTKWP
jgi:hypothetical protein